MMANLILDLPETARCQTEPTDHSILAILYPLILQATPVEKDPKRIVTIEKRSQQFELRRDHQKIVDRPAPPR